MGNFGALAFGLVVLAAAAWAVSRVMKPAESKTVSEGVEESKITEQPPVMPADLNQGGTKPQCESGSEMAASKQVSDALQPTAKHLEILKNLGIRIEISSTAPTHLSQTDPVAYVGDLDLVAPGIWLLNPNATFQMRISAPDEDTARALKVLLDESCVRLWGDVLPQIASLISRTNIRSLEIDGYVGQYKRMYLERIEEQKSKASEWADASERDREDLLKEFRRDAIQQLPVRPWTNLELLFEMERADLHIDDPLLEKYGYDVLNHYLYYADKLEEVFWIPAEHHSRTAWMQSVKVGLARRGKEIPLEKLLKALSLKQFSELSSGVEHAAFRKKAKAIEFLLGLPDIEARLERTIALRSLSNWSPYLPSWDQLILRR